MKTFNNLKTLQQHTTILNTKQTAKIKGGRGGDFIDIDTGLTLSTNIIIVDTTDL